MYSRLVLLFIICSFLFSCPEDEVPAQTVSQPEIVIDGDEYLIDTFLWDIAIDSSTIRVKKKHFIQHIFLYENLVVFHVPSQGGFVSMDSKSGEIVWDTRGDVDFFELSKSPLLHDGHLYYVRHSSFLKVNLANGAVEVRELWSNEIEFLENDLSIYDGEIYGRIENYDRIKPFFEEWIRLPLNEVNSPLNWTRFNKYLADDNNGIIQGSGKPFFQKNEDGKKLLFYHSHNFLEDFITTVNSTVACYDFDQDEIIWRTVVNKDGAFDSTSHLIDGERLYYAVDGSMVCLNNKTGEILWTADPSVFNETLAFGAGSHIVNDNIILLGRNNKVITLNKYTGETVWINDFRIGHENYGASGSQNFSFNLYNGRVYYLSISGELVSLDPSNGDTRRFYLPDRPYLEEYDIHLFEPSFKLQGMKISDDGIVYLTEGLRFLAFEVPDKSF